MDIRKVLELKKGDAIENLAAQIEAVYDFKAVGKFKSQSIRIKDSTGEIYASLQNFEIPKDSKGQKILIKRAKANVYYSAKNSSNVWGVNVAKLDDIAIGEVKEAKHEELPPEEAVGNDKTRSMALAYSKDLCVAGKIETKHILEIAFKFDNYITAGEVDCELLPQEKAEEIPFGE
jgi:hypothetical protein